MGFKRNEIWGWFHKAGTAHVRVETSGEESCAALHQEKVTAVRIFIAAGTKPDAA
jgi:hypothetical protein